MRIFAPLMAFTLMANSTLAVSARADDAIPAIAPMAREAAPPARALPPPRSASTVELSASAVETSTLARPETIREYEATTTALRKELSDARYSEEKLRIRRDLRLLDQWFEQDTEKTSGAMFVGGVVMLSAGGGAAVFTALGVAMSPLARVSISDKEGVILGGVIGGGLAVACIGFGLMEFGRARVMKPKAQPNTRPPPPSARLLLGPTTIGVGGAF